MKAVWRHRLSLLRTPNAAIWCICVFIFRLLLWCIFVPIDFNIVRVDRDREIMGRCVFMHGDY